MAVQALLAPLLGLAGRVGGGAVARAAGPKLAQSSIGRVSNFGSSLTSARGVGIAENLGENVGVNAAYSNKSSQRQNFNDGLNTGGMY